MSDEEAFQEDMLARERQSEEALDEAMAKGVSRKALMVLAREAGCVRWALEKSLQEKRA